MDKGARPVIQVRPGETLLVETEDCFSNQIREPLRHLRAVVRLLPRQPRHWSRRRGGRLPGDVLEVRIEENPAPRKGRGSQLPQLGALEDEVADPLIKIVPLDNGYSQFSPRSPSPSSHDRGDWHRGEVLRRGGDPPGARPTRIPLTLPARRVAIGTDCA